MTRIALIGCGRQAPKHISGYRAVDGVELVLIDARPERARALAAREDLPWLESAEAALADPGIAAIDICTPPPSHAPLIRRALAAGKDFFCEKPLCESAEEARALRRLTGETGRIGMVGYIYRWAPSLLRVGSILAGAEAGGRSPALGRLRACTLRLGGQDPAAAWKYRAGAGGGAIAEMMVHMIDLAQWYFGRITGGRLLARESLRPGADAEDFVLARCQTAAGVPVTIQADLVTPAFTQLLEVQGENGTIMASIQPEMPQFLYLREAAGGYPAGRTAIGAGPANLYEPQMAAFVRAVRTRIPPDRGTLAQSVEVMEALDVLGCPLRGTD